MPYTPPSPLGPRSLLYAGPLPQRTGDTAKTELLRIPRPALSLGRYGYLEVILKGRTAVSNSNSKTVFVEFGGVAFRQRAFTTLLSWSAYTIIANQGDNAIQWSQGVNAQTDFTESGSPPVIGAVDTTAAQDLVLSATLAVGTDILNLHAIVYETYRDTPQ